jgi:hypothetical protein
MKCGFWEKVSWMINHSQTFRISSLHRLVGQCNPRFCQRLWNQNNETKIDSIGWMPNESTHWYHLRSWVCQLAANLGKWRIYRIQQFEARMASNTITHNSEELHNHCMMKIIKFPQSFARRIRWDSWAMFWVVTIWYPLPVTSAAVMSYCENHFRLGSESTGSII